jgi:predicted dehydrogenase
MIRVGICGFGYWGPNLLRAFSQNRHFSVVAVADRRRDIKVKLHPLQQSLRFHEEASELIDCDDVDAVAIATPVDSHFGLAARALRRGKHVLVEKPLCGRVEEARELVGLAERSHLSLMVDHVYVFHDAVLKLKQLMTGGSLGAISYYDSLRINLGLFQPDMNVLWDLAPHDFSIMDYLFDEAPVHVEATGYCHVNQHFPDIVYVTAHYASQMIAHLNLSWISPTKVRRVAVGGSKQMVVWDDLNYDERLKIYNTGIEFQPEEARETIIPSYRIGDVYSPRLEGREALGRVVENFARMIKAEDRSPADGRAGLRTVELLERAQRALDASLRAVRGSLALPDARRAAS